MISKRALSLVAALLSALLLGLIAVPVLAVTPPPLPETHYFLGAVTIGGEQAPQGTVVSAHWDGSSKQTTVGADGNYGNVWPGFYITTGDGITPGQTITFKVNGVEAATRNFDPGTTTVLNLNIETSTSLIAGVTGEVNCNDSPGILSEATVDLYKNATHVASTVSDIDGNYSLPVTATGDYEVRVNKSGYREETQAINIPVLGPVYELDFLGETGLIPNEPLGTYAMMCVNHWLFPPGPECGLTATRAMDVINAWLFPV